MSAEEFAQTDPMRVIRIAFVSDPRALHPRVQSKNRAADHDNFVGGWFNHTRNDALAQGSIDGAVPGRHHFISGDALLSQLKPVRPATELVIH